MKNTGNYTEISLAEFIETCEIDSIDELFYKMSYESIKRTAMISKSLTEYLSKNTLSLIDKYH